MIMNDREEEIEVDNVWDKDRINKEGDIIWEEDGGNKIIGIGEERRKDG